MVQKENNLVNSLFVMFFLFMVPIWAAAMPRAALAGATSVASIGPGAGTAMSVCAFDPQNADIMYAGGDCQGVMRSLDGGKTWSAPNVGLVKKEEPFYEAYFLLGLEIDPGSTSTVYAGTQRGIYKSTDRAATWTRLDISQVTAAAGLGTHTPIGIIRVDPDDGNVIYAGLGDIYSHDPDTGKGMVLKSGDGGATWTQIGTGTIDSGALVYGIALDPDGTAAARTIIVSTDKGIYKSTDSGATFVAFETGLPHNKGRRTAVGRTSGGPTTVYLVLFPTSSLTGGVYKWQTGDDSWTDANGAAGNDTLVLTDGAGCIYNWIDLDPNNPDTVFVASAPSYVETDQCDTETFYRSADGGDSWEEMWPTPTSGWMQEGAIMAMLAVSPSSPATLLGGYLAPLISTDSGDSWAQAYCDTQSGSTQTLYKSNAPDIGSQMWSLSFAVDPRPAKADTMYQGYADTLLFKTEDMEWFWRLSADPVAGPVTDLAQGWGQNGDANLTPQVTLDPDNPDIVYASASYRLYKSTDGGATWTELTGWPNPVSDVEADRHNAARFAIDPASGPNSRTLYVTVFGQGVYKSTDGGQTWTDLSASIGALADQFSGVYLDPSDSNIIYLGTFALMHYSKQDLSAAYPIYYSGDGGATWSQFADFPPVNKMWIDPDNGTRIMVAAIDLDLQDNQGGIYLTTDSGVTWSRVLDQPVVTDLALDPHVTDRMWALSSAYYQPDTGLDTPGQAAGLYQSLDRGVTWQPVGLPLNHFQLYPLAVHPTRADELYIGTAGLGVKKVALGQSVSILADLSFTLSDLSFQSGGTALPLWADFQFYGSAGGNLVWALKDAGSAVSGGNPVDMDSSLAFFLDDAVFLSGSGNIGLSLSFAYYKEENGRHLWMLDGFNYN